MRSAPIMSPRRACTALTDTRRPFFSKYGAHAATDVTGFGILGHAQNLAKNQKLPVDFEISVLPVVSGMMEVDRAVQGGERFKLRKGLSAETSGGLLVCMPGDKAEEFCRDVYEKEGWRVFVIGRVVEGSGLARIVDDVQVVNV
eukprot:comp19658_c0_seq1/m.23278 comp19658_c0_seq1/g.23278  ORF comp19658_c0_seq1/g.23278 comp19658_c0_seq1/m.23278 type:complete len:144 (-) comp19658_c0_seq1:208-639(-)